MVLTREKKEGIVKKFKRGESDTGSPEIQIALLSGRINELTEHLKLHKKDYHSTRGLMKMIGKRNRLLKYFEKKSLDEYRKLIKELGLRK